MAASISKAWRRCGRHARFRSCPISPVGVWEANGSGPSRIDLRADGTAFSSCCDDDHFLFYRGRGTWRIERGVTRIDWTTTVGGPAARALVVTGGRAIGAHRVLTAKAPVQRDALAGSWAWASGDDDDVLVFDGEGHWTARLGGSFDTRRRYAISGAAVVLTEGESTVATIDAFEAKWHRIDGIAAAVVGKWKNEGDLIGCPGPSTEHIVHWLDLHADGSCGFRVIDGRGAHPVDHCVWFVHEDVLVVDVPNGAWREPSPFVVRGDPARPTHLYFDGRWWHR